MADYSENDGTVSNDNIDVSSGGIDLSGFNPVLDLNPANSITIGSDVYYRNADGTYTGTNSETGESFSVTPEQMSSLQNPQTSGNASMKNLAGTPTTAPQEPSSDITKWLNDKFGSKLSGIQWAGILGGGVAGLMGANKPNVTKVGYQGGIPQLQAMRNMVLAPPTKAQGYRPGQGGINYGGDVTYAPKAAAAPVVPTDQVVPAAQGGLMGMAHGGRYLQGSTDGMADKLRTSIDGKQPAALSHGEFVIPADVVSHLGNGNSDAGAKKLYSMMDKIRQARTGILALNLHY